MQAPKIRKKLENTLETDKSSIIAHTFYKEFKMPKSEEVYNYIKGYMIDNQGRAPTYREIMQAMEIRSYFYIEWVINKLVELDLIEKVRGSRCIRLKGGKFIVEEA